MKNVYGLQTAIKAVINERESENRLAVDVDDIMKATKEEVDISQVPVGWLTDFALRAAAEVALYQKGYKSVVKGEGIFVNVENCEKPEYLKRLFNNAKLSESQKVNAVNIIKKRIKETNIEGQLTIDFSNGEIVENVSEEQLLDMLKDDAEAV